MSRQGIMADCSSVLAADTDDRMRRALVPLLAALAANPAFGAPDADVLLLDDAEERAQRVNEGELVFLPQRPERPVHHHMTRLEVTRDALDSGWVLLQQCHEGLDRVPELQIVYQPGKLRRLEVVAHRNLEAAWVEGDSVQIRNVGADAAVCIAAEARALHRTGDGTYELRNGPFMRRFLDGYFPMHVSLEVLLPEGLALTGTTPEPQPGFTLHPSGRWWLIDAWFEGRLSTVLRLRDGG
jgi:hypothetical protein